MKKAIILITALIISMGAYAQIETPVKWLYAAKRTSSTEATIFLKATIQKGWHIYALNVKSGGPIKTSFKFTPSKDYKLAGKIIGPMPTIKFEKNFNMNVGYFENSVIFQQKIKLTSAKATIIKGQLEYEVCNDLKCLPPDDVNFVIPVSK